MTTVTEQQYSRANTSLGGRLCNPENYTSAHKSCFMRSLVLLQHGGRCWITFKHAASGNLDITVKCLCNLAYFYGVAAVMPHKIWITTCK
jgi:hypothetical protein